MFYFCTFDSSSITDVSEFDTYTFENKNWLTLFPAVEIASPTVILFL